MATDTDIGTTPRVVTLIPSATEIVAALGFGKHIVGRSHECDFPEGVARLPAVSAPKVRVDGSSAEIDRDIRAIVEQGLSVYRVDGERLKALRPDVIVTQSQCEVCAVSLGELEAAVADWLETRPRIVSLEPCRLADVWADIARVAEALEAPERGAALIAGLKGRMDGIRLKAERFAQSRPRLFCVEWIEPLMSAGNWMPELVALARGEALLAAPGAHAPTLDGTELRAADPDAILVMPCGWGIARAREEMAALGALDGWGELAAVRNGQVFIGDGNRYFNRPGPRLVDSLEILAEILQPELFDFGHEGEGWVRA